MKELKGTKTEKNLMEAFAGESMARNKYTYFASKAKKDGYVQISKIFEERRITARYSRDGEEHVVSCRVDEDLESRFWPMTACSAFRRMLRDIRKGRLYESDPAEAENGESGAMGDRSDN